MNVFLRAWRVYADPGRSDAAKALKMLIPLEMASFAYRALAPEEWPTLSGTTLFQVCLWYALLWFVRERDQARAELKRAKFEYVVTPARLRESDPIREWKRDRGACD